MARLLSWKSRSLRACHTTAKPGCSAAVRLGVLTSLLAGVLLVARPWHLSAQTASVPPPDSAAVAKALAATIVEGRQIFHGVGTCFACHGSKLEGTALAPTLRVHKWKNGDGSLAAIFFIDTHGVRGTAMVSHPGGINDVQAKKVATYVWAVSHGKVLP